MGYMLLGSESSCQHMHTSNGRDRPAGDLQCRHHGQGLLGRGCMKLRGECVSSSAIQTHAVQTAAFCIPMVCRLLSVCLLSLKGPWSQQATEQLSQQPARHI